MSTNDEPADEADAESVNESFYTEGENVVNGGRVTLPAKHRDYYDIDHRDVVHILFFTNKHAFQATDLPVDPEGRITIPERKRRLYDVDDGDRVAMEVEVTDMSFEET